MTLIEQFNHLRRHGITLLEEIHHQPQQLRGLSKQEMNSLRTLAAAYHAPTRSRRLQRETIAAAQRNHHSIERLRTINTYTAQLGRKLRAAEQAEGARRDEHGNSTSHARSINHRLWMFRYQLCSASSSEEIHTTARTTIDAVPTPPTTSSLRCTMNHKQGTARISLSTTSAFAADLINQLDQIRPTHRTAEENTHHHSSSANHAPARKGSKGGKETLIPRHESLGLGLEKLLREGKSLATPPVSPVIPIGLNDAKALRGYGTNKPCHCDLASGESAENVTAEQTGKGCTCNPHETLFARSDGRLMTGTELIQEILMKEGMVNSVYFMLVDPVEGPLNLYKLRRTADFKQRIMAMAEAPVCSWPGCGRPANGSQVHHLRAFKHGGETLNANLTILCEYHNGVNDDDRHEPNT